MQRDTVVVNANGSVPAKTILQPLDNAFLAPLAILKVFVVADLKYEAYHEQNYGYKENILNYDCILNNEFPQ